MELVPSHISPFCGQSGLVMVVASSKLPPTWWQTQDLFSFIISVSWAANVDVEKSRVGDYVEAYVFIL